MPVVQFLLIHRRVRTGHDRGNGLARKCDRGPDAQRRTNRISGYVDRFGRVGANLLGDLGDLVDAVDVGRHDEYLVAARTPNRVPSADAFADPCRQRCQHDVTDAVSPRVVDVLEVVDVAEQDADVCSSRARLLQRRLEARHGLGPVRQPGKGVETGQSFESLLRLDLVIGESQRSDQPIRIALGIDIEFRVAVDPAIAGVDGADPEPFDDRIAVADLLQRGYDGVEVVGMDAVVET